MKDMVNHPDHYKSANGLETIDVIEAFTSNLTGIEATDTGNILKYMCRWKQKNGLEDLKKAQWYLNHLISKVESSQMIAHVYINSNDSGLSIAKGAGIGGIIGTLTIDKNEETTNYEKESIDHE